MAADKKQHVEKVLLIAPEMAPRGTSEYTLNLAGELLNCGLRVAVFCVPGPMLDAVRREGIQVETFAYLERGILHWTERKQFLQAVGRFGPQVVHLQSMRVCAVLKDLKGVPALPLVLTVHSRPANVRTLRRLAGSVRAIIATSEGVRQGLVNQCRIEKAKIAFIANGIDVEAIAERSVRPIFSNPTVVVGSVGPVEEGRGHDLFIRAASTLVRAGARREFVVAGEGKELPQLKKLVTALGLDNYVTFVEGFSAYKEILDALDIVVQSSLVDVSGFSMLEAMGHGRPVVAFNTGTACEIIEDGKTGFLVPKGDVEALADIINQLCEEQEMAVDVAGNARSSVRERFDIRKVARQTIDLYDRLLNEQSPTG